MKPGVSVLMYHAVADGALASAGADAHYSVGTAAYAEQLAALAGEGWRVGHVRAVEAAQAAGQPADRWVGFTFDDGHVSNARAAEALARRGWSADFFVNPSTVGTPNYLSWSDLRDMAAMGMSIQSHGQHHRFLDELAPAEVEAELRDSKRAIEDALGLPVEVYAPAGGRQAPGLAGVAQRLGYQVLCTSRVGIWHPAPGARWDVPRFAVLATTTLPQFRSWVSQRGWAIHRQRVRYEALAFAKRLLGNGAYVRLRRALLGADEAGAA